ncbi:glucose 1-dehydrogenase [Agrobacterium sp. NPDC090283]|uniref:glucose 1-dehydrogenase n=1 Tax=Agrobacterium sp. NPDC090283 TaxID=3363920 RepID=UPI00383B2F61
MKLIVTGRTVFPSDEGRTVSINRGCGWCQANAVLAASNRNIVEGRHDMAGMDIKGKSILITGGGSGIGAAAVQLAAQLGAKVTIADRDRAGGEAVLARVLADGGDAQFTMADIADEAQVQDMINKALDKYGRLDCAFNNAGVAGYSHQPGAETVLLGELSTSAFERNLSINAFGTFLCMKYEIQAMLASGGGSIVNTASIAGILAVEAAADYVASKHAVVGLTKTAALDYAKKNIRVNAVLPGVIMTRMIEESFGNNPELVSWTEAMQPVGRLGKPTEVAEAALWLLSDAASFVTGVSLPVDGGFSMV